MMHITRQRQDALERLRKTGKGTGNGRTGQQRKDALGRLRKAGDGVQKCGFFRTPIPGDRFRNPCSPGDGDRPFPYLAVKKTSRAVPCWFLYGCVFRTSIGKYLESVFKAHGEDATPVGHHDAASKGNVMHKLPFGELSQAIRMEPGEHV